MTKLSVRAGLPLSHDALGRAAKCSANIGGTAACVAPLSPMWDMATHSGLRAVNLLRSRVVVPEARVKKPREPARTLRTAAYSIPQRRARHAYRAPGNRSTIKLVQAPLRVDPARRRAGEQPLRRPRRLEPLGLVAEPRVAGLQVTSPASRGRTRAAPLAANLGRASGSWAQHRAMSATRSAGARPFLRGGVARPFQGCGRRRLRDEARVIVLIVSYPRLQ